MRTDDVAALQNAYAGGEGYTALAIQYDPMTQTGDPNATSVLPTSFLPDIANNLVPKVARVQQKVRSGNRFAQRIDLPSQFSAEGTIEFPLNPALGIELLQAGLGGSATQTLVTANATGSAVTTNGITDIPVTGAYQIGFPVECGTGADFQNGQIVGYTVGHLLVTGLDHPSTIAANTAIKMVAGTKYANSLLPAGFGNQMPLVYVERCQGNLWSWGFPACLVETLDISVTNALVTTTAGMFGMRKPVYLNAASKAAYAPSAQTEAQALAPYTANTMVLAMVGDPAGGGTTAQNGAIPIKDIKFTLNNGLKKLSILGNRNMLGIPGDDAVLDIAYSEYDTGHRPAVFDDYVSTGLGAAVFAMFGKNFGGSVGWRYVSLYVPNAVYDDSALNDKTGDFGQFDNKARGLVQRGLPQDLLQIIVS